MSQMVGYPTQYPSVSMVIWNNGGGNSRYFVLRMLIEHFGLKNGARSVDLVDTTSTGLTFGQGFVINENGRETLKILVVNKSATQQSFTIDGVKGQTMMYVDIGTGPYNKPVTTTLQSDSFLLQGHGVGVIVLSK